MRPLHFLLLGACALTTACTEPSAVNRADAGPAADVGETSDAMRSGGVVSATYVLPASIPALAEEIRRGGGKVMLMETVSVDARGMTASWPTGITDLYERRPTATLTVRVVDALGETAPEMFTVETIAGPTELVDARGEPRTDWIVSGSAPTAMRMPPTEGRWLLFGFPEAEGLSSVRQVARVEGETVLGEFFEDVSNIPIDSLRR